MKIQKKQINALLIELVLLIILWFAGAFYLGYEANSIAVMRTIGLAATLTLVVLLGVLRYIGGGLNYFHLFLGLSFMFSFGQSFIAFFTGTVDTDRLLSVGNGVLSAKAIYDSSFYVLRCIVFLTIGYTIFFDKKAREYYGCSQKSKRALDKYKRFNTIGWILFLLSIVPTYYVLYQEIVILNSEGYIASLQGYTGAARILRILMGFFPASFIIIILTERRKHKRQLAYILMAIYILLQLMGGSRIVVFRFLVLFLTIYFIKHRNIKLRTIVLLGILLIAVGFIFSIVSGVRNYQNVFDSPDDLISLILQQFTEENIFYKVFFESGNSQIINTIVYTECPGEIDYCYGQSLVKMFLSIIPNLGFWDINPTTITTDSTFSPLFTDLCGLGSSIFAESYWNFGELGAYLFIFLFGSFLSILVNKLYKKVSYGNVIGTFIIYYILFYVSFLVRSDMIEFGRSFVYYCLVPVLLFKMLKVNNFGGNLEKNTGYNYRKLSKD